MLPGRAQVLAFAILRTYQATSQIDERCIGDAGILALRLLYIYQSWECHKRPCAILALGEKGQLLNPCRKLALSTTQRKFNKVNILSGKRASRRPWDLEGPEGFPGHCSMPMG